MDSIQTVYLGDHEGNVGGVTQVAASARAMQNIAKTQNTSVLITGHVTKDGLLAGPRSLEHLVDVVLSLEGDPIGEHRWLYASKNRFGSNEVGAFEFGDAGFKPVPQENRVFEDTSTKQHDGVAYGLASYGATGSRFAVAEIQALCVPIGSSLVPPKLRTTGVKNDRASMILSVVQGKVKGFEKISTKNIHINIGGGLKLLDPGADLALAMALMSSDARIPIDFSRGPLGFIGEISLTGELRVPRLMSSRLSMAHKSGLKRVVVPSKWKDKKPKGLEGLDLVKCDTLYDAAKVGLKKAK